MKPDHQKILFSAIRLLLQPLVRIMLRNGVAHGAFTELTRKVFVDVAFDEFTPQGKKQTVSRVSALTGLTRKDVKRLHELEQTDEVASQARFNRGVRVISGWMHDVLFLDDEGKSMPLPLNGTERSFDTLVRRYSGDIPTRAMLSALLESGSVEVEKDVVRLVRHAYVPDADEAEKLDILGHDVFEIISTIDHNLTAAPAELRFQRKVSYDNVDPESMLKLRKLSAKKAQSLLEQLDKQYARHELDTSSDAGKTISMGIYYFEENHTEGDQP